MKISRAIYFLSIVLGSLVIKATGNIVTIPPATHPGAGQTVYFVLTDRFANANPSNDTGGYEGDADDHGFDPTRISHYHGGDIAGLTAHLDYLKNLGMTAVWFTPPLKNKPMQAGTAGYHGYWITDFEQIDPHLGTNQEFHTLIREAHARGMRVYMDIIVNHTADVIKYQSGNYEYQNSEDSPYIDAAGNEFDARDVAFNGLTAVNPFPILDATTSFPLRPVVAPDEADLKNPAWLNDLTLYHNRGSTTFEGENSIYGDFAGLDDVFTEHPRVVAGFIDIFAQWLHSGIDGYRIDTARHVNSEFWQQFNNAIRQRARELGRTDFVQFGEVYNDKPEAPYVLSEFSTRMPMDTTLDFGFFNTARRFISQQGNSAELAEFFATDDLYTDHDSNIHATPTFLGNHDAGRFPHFLQMDTPGIGTDEMLSLTEFAHGLLYLVRGSPVLYYGAEQGMIGTGGWDMRSRESMFASRAPDFRHAELLGTERTGADDKFDSQHPLYQFLAQMGTLRAGHQALRTGAMLVRPTKSATTFAFSRVDRGELVEYLAVFNRDRRHSRTLRVATSQPAGAKLGSLYQSSAQAESTALQTDRDGTVEITLAPLSFAVFKADSALNPIKTHPKIEITNPQFDANIVFSTRVEDGLTFPSRAKIAAEVSGTDGVGEVTFTFERASQPGQTELIGTDDAAPYSVYWRPPADLAADDVITFSANFTDLRGRITADEVTNVTVASHEIAFGITGSESPVVHIVKTSDGKLEAIATGTAPFEYQWLRDGEFLTGENNAWLIAPERGNYRAVVRNRAGTTISSAHSTR